MGGLLGDILSGVLAGVKENVQQFAQMPENIIKNGRANINGAIADTKGIYTPDTGFDDKIYAVGPVLGSAIGQSPQMYRAKETFKWTVTDEYGTPFELEVKKGQYLARFEANNPLFSRNGENYSGLLTDYHGDQGIGVHNTRLTDPYRAGSLGRGRDWNNDLVFDRLTVDSHGRSWVVYGISNTLLSKTQGSSIFDRENRVHLPYQFQNTATGSQYYNGVLSQFTLENERDTTVESTGPGEWLVTRKPYRTFDNLNALGSHPLFGQQIGTSGYQPGFGYGSLIGDIYGLHYDPNNPDKAYYDTTNTLRSFDTEPVVTTMTIASPDVMDPTKPIYNPALVDLKKKLEPKDPYTNLPLRTFKNGILSGEGPLAGITYPTFDADGNVTGSVDVINAYVNVLGELIVEYA